MFKLKFTKRRSITLLSNISLWLCLFLYNCTNQKSNDSQSATEIIQASLEAVGKKNDRDNLKNLVAVADCISPSGKYSTEIHTANGGYSWFKQSFSYKDEPFEAIIENQISGYQISDSLIPLSKETIYVIRGHEFQNIVLEVDKRFHDFEKPEKIVADSLNVYRVAAKDELNHSCLLFFDSVSKLLTTLHFKNPGNQKEIIKIKFLNWKEVQELQLPYHVEIDQAGKIYTFNYSKISINSPHFRYKKLKQ